MDNSSKYCMAYSSKRRATFATVGLTRLIWRFKNRVFFQAKFIFNTFFTISLLLQVFISRCLLTLSECPNPAVSWLTHPRWLIHYGALMFALQNSCVFISKAVFNGLLWRKYFQPRLSLAFSLGHYLYRPEPHTTSDSQRPLNSCDYGALNNSIKTSLTTSTSAQIVQLLLFPLKCLL